MKYWIIGLIVGLIVGRAIMHFDSHDAVPTTPSARQICLTQGGVYTLPEQTTPCEYDPPRALSATCPPPKGKCTYGAAEAP